MVINISVQYNGVVFSPTFYTFDPRLLPLLLLYVVFFTLPDWASTIP